MLSIWSPSSSSVSNQSYRQGFPPCVISAHWPVGSGISLDSLDLDMVCSGVNLNSQQDSSLSFPSQFLFLPFFFFSILSFSTPNPPMLALFWWLGFCLGDLQRTLSGSGNLSTALNPAYVIGVLTPYLILSSSFALLLGWWKVILGPSGLTFAVKRQVIWSQEAWTHLDSFCRDLTYRWGRLGACAS